MSLDCQLCNGYCTLIKRTGVFPSQSCNNVLACKPHKGWSKAVLSRATLECKISLESHRRDALHACIDKFDRIHYDCFQSLSLLIAENESIQITMLRHTTNQLSCPCFPPPDSNISLRKLINHQPVSNQLEESHYN